MLNLANLSGRSGNLLAPGFGQPTSRVTQVFGSGNPRSFPFAERKFLITRARSLLAPTVKHSAVNGEPQIQQLVSLASVNKLPVHP